MIPGWLLVCALAATLGLAIAMPRAEAAGADLPPAAAALAPELRRVFERSCAECHDRAKRAKPKGGFGHVLDLARLAADDDYVVPGRPDQSELHLLLVTDDEDLLMPPRDSDAPPLSAAEIKLVSDWILALAAPPAAELPPAAPPPTLAGPPPPRAAVSARKVFARLHPMLVHFPVALLIVAAGVELLGFVRRRPGAGDSAVGVCLAVAALGAPLSALTGWLLAPAEGYSDATVWAHRWLGVAVTVLSPILWALHRRCVRTGTPGARRLVLALLLLAALLVAIVGHTGGEITRGAGYPFN
jgi:uncharacterized membrane protein/mono/diheme cytochrome c family protein